MPLKIKAFIWLALEGKILTWDSLQKRGWEGPGRFLCVSWSQNLSPIFLFTVLLQEPSGIYMIKDLKVRCCWNGNTLSECIKNWHEEKSTPSQISALICWNIWMSATKLSLKSINHPFWLVSINPRL
jgi:hypothetical protein